MKEIKAVFNQIFKDVDFSDEEIPEIVLKTQCYEGFEAGYKAGLKAENEACASDMEGFVETQRQIKKESYHPGFDAGFEACMSILLERAEAIRDRSRPDEHNNHKDH